MVIMYIVIFQVANILLAHSGKQGGPLTAALEIARQSARVILAPLLDALCDRLAYVLRWLFDVALHRLKLEIDSKISSIFLVF